MARRFVTFLTLFGLASACSGGENNRPVTEVKPGPASTRLPPGVSPQVTPPPLGTGDATPAAAMTLDEAKAKCAGCHEPGGSGAGVWSTAAGSEQDWKLFAAAAKDSVESDRMPLGSPLAASEKKRFLAFLGGLLGSQPLQPPEWSFETASRLCTGCHSSSAPDEFRTEPYLETREQWQAEKSDIREAVSAGWMPLGKTLSDVERAALLRFIESWNGPSGASDDKR